MNQRAGLSGLALSSAAKIKYRKKLRQKIKQMKKKNQRDNLSQVSLKTSHLYFQRSLLGLDARLLPRNLLSKPIGQLCNKFHLLPVYIYPLHPFKHITVKFLYSFSQYWLVNFVQILMNVVFLFV